MVRRSMFGVAGAISGALLLGYGLGYRAHTGKPRKAADDYASTTVPGGTGPHWLEPLKSQRHRDRYNIICRLSGIREDAIVSIVAQSLPTRQNNGNYIFSGIISIHYVEPIQKGNDCTIQLTDIDNDGINDLIIRQKPRERTTNYLKKF